MTQDPFFFNIKASCKYFAYSKLCHSLPQLGTPSRSINQNWYLNWRQKTQTGIKSVALLMDQNNYLTWLVLISMNERIIQQKVNSFCWEKHTSHHFHTGSLVKQNWRPHKMSQLFIFHLRCKLYFMNHLHALIFQIVSITLVAPLDYQENNFKIWSIWTRYSQRTEVHLTAALREAQ